jgi:hypothetical protein
MTKGFIKSPCGICKVPHNKLFRCKKTYVCSRCLKKRRHIIRMPNIQRRIMQIKQITEKLEGLPQ